MEPILPQMDKDVAESAGAGVIAVIDDDHDIAIALTAWLGLTGYRAVGFPSAEAMIEALVPGGEDSVLSLAPAGEGRVRLVGAIIDVMLPGISGLQLATRLRDADREFPIVLISAGTSTQLAHLGQAPDGVRLLSKPFDLTEMATALFGPPQAFDGVTVRRSAA